MNVLETQRLGKRYGRSGALRNCTLAVPAGRVVALIARELESGTFRFAWTQGRSRRPDTTSARPD